MFYVVSIVNPLSIIIIALICIFYRPNRSKILLKLTTLHIYIYLLAYLLAYLLVLISVVFFEGSVKINAYTFVHLIYRSVDIMALFPVFPLCIIYLLLRLFRIENIYISICFLVVAFGLELLLAVFVVGSLYHEAQDGNF